jgi:thiosulfate dehydrogenase [quinone] large subunit
MRDAAGPRLLGPAWQTHRFAQLGWQLLPLRAFLGVTFLYASLQKLANPDYLRAGSPTSVVAQMRSLEATSPIGPLLRLSMHAPTLVGLLIAIGELAVALGILAGLWTRLAAVAGMLLSLTFFLTVSWGTRPYYYGSDIVFFFAWTVFAACGAGGVLSVDAWIQARAAGGPAYGVGGRTRREILVGARSAALLAGLGAVVGGVAAGAGRVIGGTKTAAGSAPSQLPGTTPASPPVVNSGGGAGQAGAHHKRRQAAHRGTAGGGNQATPGRALAPVSAVPVGHGRQFTDPRSGRPGWLLRPSTTQILAFSAVCTHAGCTVGFDAAADEFVCPCHGGRYSARTGAVLSGPPPAPLTRIPARIVGHEIRVD